MGYRSEVRIMTTKKGFKELNKYVKNYLSNLEHGDYNLLDDLKIKAENDYAVYFGWSWIKWYGSYQSVEAIESGLNHLKDNEMSYRFARIGENYDDYEESSYESENEEEQDLEYPSVIREFDDSYVIEEMGRVSPVKEFEGNEI